MVSRRKFLSGVAFGTLTAGAFASLPSLANAAGPENFWNSFNSSVQNYSSRLNSGGARNLNTLEIRTRLAAPLRRAAVTAGATSTAPAWLTLGALARGFGVSLIFETIVAGTYKILTSDGDRIAITTIDTNSAAPTDWDFIAGDVPANTVRKYSNNITALVTHESGQFLSDVGRNRFGPRWQWVYTRLSSPISSVTLADGTIQQRFAHVWRFVPLEPGDQPHLPAPDTQTQTDLAAEIAKLLDSDALSRETMAKLLNKMAEAERARDPSSPLPDPLADPFTPGDIVAPRAPVIKAPLPIPVDGQDPATVAGDAPGAPDTPPSTDPAGGSGFAWGQFTPPALPSIPDPSDFFRGWFNPMSALVPIVPDHNSTCPVIRFQWIDGRPQAYDKHCAVGDQIRPTLRAGAAVSAGLAAFWTVVSA